MHNSVGVLQAIKEALPRASITHVVGEGITGDTTNPEGLLPLENHGCGWGNGSEVWPPPPGTSAYL
jgi:hypothetical protein